MVLPWTLQEDAPSYPSNRAEEYTPGNGELPLDGGLSKAFKASQVIAPSLSTLLSLSELGTYTTTVELTRDDHNFYSTPIMDGDSFSEFTFQINRLRLPQDEVLATGLDAAIVGELAASVDKLDNISYAPNDLSVTSVVHSAFRSAIQAGRQDFAAVLPKAALDTLSKASASTVSSTQDGEIWTPTTYAGIQLFTSDTIPDDTMFLIDKSSAFVGYLDAEIRETKAVKLGAALAPHSIAYKMVDDCHDTQYVFTEETNDYCLDCSTCGYSYWAGTEAEAIERLTEHTEDKVYFSLRKPEP